MEHNVNSCFNTKITFNLETYVVDFIKAFRPYSQQFIFFVTYE
jgi:hypothetical protein